MAAPIKSRLAWIDMIKGTSVVLVVFMHVVVTLQTAVGDTVVSGFWAASGALLEPLRMPVFFLVSGMLAASAINRPWSVTKKRTIGIGYLYILWTTVLILVSSLASSSEGPLATLGTWGQTLALVASGYWYLLALVVFFVIARLFRNVTAWVVLVIAALPNLMRPLTADVLNSWNPSSLAPSMAMNLVFFLAGAYYKDVFTSITKLATWNRAMGLGALLVAAGVWRQLSPELWGYTFLPLSVGWIVLAIMIAHLLSRHDASREIGEYLGARTLPVFVIQFPALVLLNLALANYGGFLSNPLAQLVYPIVVTAALVAFSLWIYAAAAATPMWWLFEAPSVLTDPKATVPSPRIATDGTQIQGSSSPALLPA